MSTDSLDELVWADLVGRREMMRMLEFTDLSALSTWRLRPAGELIDHLEQTHHHYLRAELPRLTELHRRVTRAHRWEHPELEAIGDLFEELRLDLEPHVAKEERVLFPLARRLCNASIRPMFDCGSIANPISVMLREHDLNRDLFRQLHSASNGYRVPDGASEHHRELLESLARLERDTEVHHGKENDILFPAIVMRESELSP